MPQSRGEFHDSWPTLRRAHYTTKTWNVSLFKKVCHLCVCRNHEILDDLACAIAFANNDIRHIPVGCDGIRFNCVKFQCPVLPAKFMKTRGRL